MANFRLLVSTVCSFFLTSTLDSAFGQTNKPVAQAKSNADTRAIMDTLIGSFSEVLPLSFDMKEFSSKKNKSEILKSLRKLKDNAHVLEQHGEIKDKGFEFVTKSLETDANNAYRWFEKGYYDEAKFTLHNMTENCIACHNSLPETAKFPKPERFLSKINLQNLPALDKAHYLTMSRQFDEALTAYETVFNDPDIQPSNLIALGAFTQYMKLSINVKSNFNRPQKLLLNIAERPNTPKHVKELVLKWQKQLEIYEKSAPLAQITIPGIRKTIEAGKLEMEFPKDREGLIHYVTANAMLNRYVNGNPSNTTDMAEAYYLMGVTESLLGHSFWVSRQDFYLETAIRIAPGSSFSSKAYSLLEDSLVSGFTGSSGTNLPDDVAELLSELKTMIDSAKKEKS